jgi:hypothetical protein
VFTDIAVDSSLLESSEGSGSPELEKSRKLETGDACNSDGSSSDERMRVIENNTMLLV